MNAPALQPDQTPSLWNEYAGAYERVFEPLTDRFATCSLDLVSPKRGERLLDVGAGTGGAALMAADRGASVLAVDAAPAMAERIRARASGRDVHPIVTDACALPLAPASVDSALSIFGVILCPDPVIAFREIRRVLVPGGAAAIVTWTEPHNYELATRLMAAAATVRGPLVGPPGAMPAQLRFTAEADFGGLFASAGFSHIEVGRVEARLEAPNARWLGDHLAFAPGLAALLGAMGADRERVVDTFVADLERDQGPGPVGLRAVAFVGLGRA